MVVAVIAAAIGTFLATALRLWTMCLPVLLAAWLHQSIVLSWLVASGPVVAAARLRLRNKKKRSVLSE